jgi:glycosyltransferase involved in cell wall biosynthesis
MTTPLRVFVIADLAAERWVSMDLVAERLVAELRSRPDDVSADLVRPQLTGGGTLRRYVNRFWTYPQWLRQHACDADVYHVVDHSYAHLVHALPADRTVVTCHDIDAFLPLVAPELTGSRLPRALVRRTLSGLRHAALVTCDSVATRDELVRYDLVPADRLAVVPVGVDPCFTPSPDATADQVIRTLLGPSGEYVDLLHVGTCIPRKRIDRLLHIVNAVRTVEPRVRLVKVGGALTVEQQELARRLGLTGRIVTLPFLSREALAALYRRAAVVIVPSDREGFGLPVAEAMACGTPVVATDLPVFREVGGNAIHLCDAGDTDAWRDTIVRLVGEAASDRSCPARRRAVARAGRFSWSACADAMLDAYRRVQAMSVVARAAAFPAPEALEPDARVAHTVNSGA